ncbi:hypothetical protein COCSUDRAFT_54360 [Coccomyxa subellipsoidea C-169]|uniref:Uncharacterized protein n=1 Tax=Coccomyxa subellipsoidea (strain C-169) TaxID=574566 RepID=I0YQA5_COCSC|nr:hypothetical protein COCSUDRAFT_54360 [Coccomyxa subellipsoidea C-169]EIE20574.1 hypothetical protein COCSUDRAFT_54360 [Coccomyxa subellipsoidea C-169]|eukprot:XP_005645118.1 hypothetical protein COCSUDRAFT_54360 [Coccomyxa subellipsoidea C-169]
MMAQWGEIFTTVQYYLLGLGFIFPNKRDELAFLQYVGKRNVPRASFLHSASCIAWLLYLVIMLIFASTDQNERWRYTMAGDLMAFTALSDICAVIAAQWLFQWYYRWHEHLKAGLAIISICTIMQAGILLQGKEPSLLNAPIILLLHAIKLTIDQVRLSTAVWLWALQLGALLLMSVGQQFEGTGGSEIHPLVQVLLFFSIFGVIALGIALEARTRLHFCRLHDRPRGALGNFWECVNVCLILCKGATRKGILKMGILLRYPLNFTKQF